MDNLDFPVRAREDFGLDAVEYVNVFFFDKAKDAGYLAGLRSRAEDHGVQSLLIMCDNEGDLGAPDASERARVVQNHQKWVDAAQALGCHSIRVNARSNPDLAYAEQQKHAADGLRALADYASQADISVIVENHGGLSSNGRWLAGVMELADHPLVGTLPDFGNFLVGRNADTGEEEWYDRYQGVEELMPYAKAVSAKSHDFDPDGNERHTDFERMMRIVLNAGYRGYVGIEYEGQELSEPDGVRKTLDLLERVRGALAEEA